MNYVQFSFIYFVLIIGNISICIWGFFKNKDIKHLISLNTTISSFAILFMSLVVSGLIKMYQGSFYPFHLPFFIHVITTFLLSLCLLVISKTTPRIVVGSVMNILNGTLFLSAIYVMSKWPGGDDGPGIAWGIFVIPGCIVSSLIAIFGMIRNYQLLKEEI